METRDYSPELLCAVTALYNEATEFVPNCWPVGEGEFAGAVAGVLGGKSDGGPEGVEEQQLVVAVDGGEVLGFVHFGRYRGDEDDEVGAICFICYRRGRRDVGQALVRGAERWFTAKGFAAVVAFQQRHRYRFYGFAHTYLSDRLDHVGALLQFNGYEKSGGEVFLNGMGYAAAGLPELELEFDEAWEWPRKRGTRPGCHLKATQGDKLLGECVVYCAGDFSTNVEAQDYGFVNWLGVTEGYQGGGLGKWLLLRTRNEMLERGYRHTAISTAVSNHRAFLFYSNYGYRVVDWTYGLSKSLLED